MDGFSIALGLIGGFAGMEGFSWAIHKYLMHGPLWFIHQTHHRPGKGFFEANDVFSLLFGTSAALSVYFGFRDQHLLLAGAGLGVTSYGLVYFVLHDVGVHGRVKSAYLQRLPWLSRIRRAHKIHHKYLGRTPGKSFGLLFVDKSVFEQPKQL